MTTVTQQTDDRRIVASDLIKSIPQVQQRVLTVRPVVW